MSSTRPPGANTGLVTAGCYAAALRDCDGKAASREHYVSSCILERIPNVLIDGLAWQTGKPKRVGTKAYVSNVLCARHNNVLGATDTAMCRLFDALLAFHDGKPVGWHEIDGEDLERWALKTLFALIASGNMRLSDGMESDRPPPIESYLRVLFSDEDVPADAGMFVIRGPIAGVDYSSEMTLKPLLYPLAHVRAGQVAGIVVSVLGFGFYTTIDHRFLDDILRHRPLGIAFRDRGEQGCLALRWKNTTSSEVIVMRSGASEL